MKKTTKEFIGTLGGALLGSSILGIAQIINWATINFSPFLGNLLPLIGLIIGGIIGYYVARNI